MVGDLSKRTWGEGDGSFGHCGYVFRVETSGLMVKLILN